MNTTNFDVSVYRLHGLESVLIKHQINKNQPDFFSIESIMKRTEGLCICVWVNLG